MCWETVFDELVDVLLMLLKELYTARRQGSVWLSAGVLEGALRFRICCACTAAAAATAPHRTALQAAS